MANKLPARPPATPVDPLPETPPAEEPDDAALITKINAGDFDAFTILYHRHRDWVFRMAYRITDSPDLADDALQEVFRYFLGKFPGFALTCALRTFFYPVVRNVSLNLVRKSRRYDGGPAAAAHLDNLPAKTQHPSELGEINQMVAHLSDEHRETLLLRYVDEMTVPEIAKLLGIPLGTVKSRLHHAIAALRANPEFRRRYDFHERIAQPDC